MLGWTHRDLLSRLFLPLFLLFIPLVLFVFSRSSHTHTKQEPPMQAHTAHFRWPKNDSEGQEVHIHGQDGAW